MKILDGASWPKELEAELCRQVDAIAPRVFLMVSKNPQICPPGYRISEKTVEVFRNRLKGALLHDKATDGTMDFFRKNCFYQYFVCVLSTRALTEGFESMANFTGGAKLVLGMLMDPREAVRKKALEVVASGAEFAPVPEDPDAARAKLAETFEPFVKAFSTVAVAQNVTVVHRDVSDQRQIEMLQGSLRKANDALREVRKAKEDAVRQGKVESEKVSGLEARVSALEGKVATVKKAQKEAEAARLEMEGKNVKLRHRVKDLAGFEKEVLESRARIRALERQCEAARVLCGELEAKLAEQEETEREQEERALREHIEVAPEPVVAPERSLRERLLDALGAESVPEGRSIRLLLDGHNVLNLVPRFAERIGVDSHGANRERLVQVLVARRGEFGVCDVEVYFDGEERSDSTHAKNVHVHYSGGQGEHRADRAILDVLEFYIEAGMFCVVVTEDSDFRAEAMALGSHVIGSREFFELL